jgi:chromosome segregation ATPase
MKKTLAVVGIVVCLLAGGGCAARQEASVVKEVPVVVEKVVSLAPASDGSGTTLGYRGADEEAYAAEERMIVYSAQLGLVVEDTARAVDRIKNLVVSAGGYVASSRTWYEGPTEKEQLHGYLTVRVPAGSLDQALSDFKALAIKVEQENLDGQDVTEEYSDLSAQLTNLEATETELRELLTEVRENRGKASEILEVHNRLTEIRGQIERLKGRMQYLERSAAMARIDIQLMPEEAPVEIIEDEWKITRTVRSAARALVQGLQFVADVLVFLVFLSPVWGIPLAIILGLRALVRRRRKRKAAAKEALEEVSAVEET